MKAASAKPTTIDEYIAAAPSEVRAILENIRVTVRKAAPGAEETISYQMPTFCLHGALIYFGAFKKHIGLYPPVRDEKLRLETARYAGEKGNLQLPLDEPILYALIARIVKARVRENREREEAKRKKKAGA